MGRGGGTRKIGGGGGGGQSRKMTHCVKVSGGSVAFATFEKVCLMPSFIPLTTFSFALEHLIQVCELCVWRVVQCGCTDVSPRWIVNVMQLMASIQFWVEIMPETCPKRVSAWLHTQVWFSSLDGAWDMRSTSELSTHFAMKSVRCCEEHRFRITNYPRKDPAPLCKSTVNYKEERTFRKLQGISFVPLLRTPEE